MTMNLTIRIRVIVSQKNLAPSYLVTYQTPTGCSYELLVGHNAP